MRHEKKSQKHIGLASRHSKELKGKGLPPQKGVAGGRKEGKIKSLWLEG